MSTYPNEDGQDLDNNHHPSCPLYKVPEEAARSPRTHRGGNAMSLTLEALDGPGKGRRVGFPAGKTHLVGSGSHCHLVLDHEWVLPRYLATVNLQHCRLRVEDGGAFVCGIDGGTYLNSEVVPTRGLPLKDGDLLGIGPVLFKVILNRR